MSYSVVPRAFRFVLPVLAGAAVVATTGLASAQIKQPGAHPKYSVELEPHLVFDWTDHHNWSNNGDAFGPGIRATIPFLDNGPISKINNNMGIGFGLDWAHNGDACHGWRWGNRFYATGYDCTVDIFHFPVVVQWNFFLTDIISVFGEAGLSIERVHWSSDPCPVGYDCSDSHTYIDPVFWGGGRFLFGKGSSVSGIVRLGWPYVSLGIGILL